MRTQLDTIIAQANVIKTIECAQQKQKHNFDVAAKLVADETAYEGE